MTTQDLLGLADRLEALAGEIRASATEEQMRIEDAPRINRILLPEDAKPRCRHLSAEEWNAAGVVAWAESTPYEVVARANGDAVESVCSVCEGRFKASKTARQCGNYCEHALHGRTVPRRYGYERRVELAIEDAAR